MLSIWQEKKEQKYRLSVRTYADNPRLMQHSLLHVRQMGCRLYRANHSCSQLLRPPYDPHWCASYAHIGKPLPRSKRLFLSNQEQMDTSPRIVVRLPLPTVYGAPRSGGAPAMESRMKNVVLRARESAFTSGKTCQNWCLHDLQGERMMATHKLGCKKTWFIR